MGIIQQTAGLLSLLSSLVATTTAAQKQSCQEADILILGGTIVTMNPNRDIIRDGGIAIVGTKLDYVGTKSDVEDLYCQDNKGKTIVVDNYGIILPGLINAHNHSPMTLLRSIAGDNLPLQDWLNNFIFPAEALTVNPDFVRTGTALAAMEMISTGTTTFADQYYFIDDQAKEVDKIGMRAVLGSAVIGFPSPDAATPEDALVLIRTLLEEWEGHPLITISVAPHSPYTLSADNLQASANLAREFGVPIIIHVSENQVEVDTVMGFTNNSLTPFEFLDSLDFLGPDVVAAHSVVLSDNDIDIIQRTNTGLVHNPESNMKLASGVQPLPQLLERGIYKIGLGTDGPASNDNLDMFQALLVAPLLQKVVNLEPTILSALPVLEMATIRGAAVLGMNDTIGSLEVGKEADLIILDGNAPHMVPAYDILSLLVYSAKGCDVKTTIVAGQVLYEDKEFLTLDPKAIIAAAREQADIVRAAIGLNDEALTDATGIAEESLEEEDDATTTTRSSP